MAPSADSKLDFLMDNDREAARDVLSSGGLEDTAGLKLGCYRPVLWDSSSV